MRDDILLPFIGMMLLTFVVWVVMYRRRIGYLRAQRIHPQKLQTPEQLKALVPADIEFASNNLRNLFELPVLFYALCLYVHVTGTTDWLYVAAAWSFLLLRCAHSFVHCTTNVVMTRFWLYVLSSTALWLMLGHAVVDRFR
jgi:hypothetical protein